MGDVLSSGTVVGETMGMVGLAVELRRREGEKEAEGEAEGNGEGEGEGEDKSLARRKILYTVSGFRLVETGPGTAALGTATGLEVTVTEEVTGNGATFVEGDMYG
jgi:hypothetical protein